MNKSQKNHPEIVFAWTEKIQPNASPAFMNITRGDGMYTIKVRPRGSKEHTTIEITPQALEGLLIEVAADLHR
jgi:hypothetical protein